MRRRLFSVSLSLFSASLFFDLYFVIPAASSKIKRRSSGLELKIRSILPCSIKEYDSAPIPVPINNSKISLSLTCVLLIKYSLSPERKSLREIVTSPYSIGSILDSLEKVSETSAKPTPILLSVPLKITSSILEPRIAFTLCSPKTQRTLSKILLLPQPFGPTTAVMPGWKFKTVLSAKDLKPLNSSLLRYICLFLSFY